MQKLTLEARTSFLAIELGVINRLGNFLLQLPETTAVQNSVDEGVDIAGDDGDNNKKEPAVRKIDIRFLAKEMQDNNDAHDFKANLDAKKIEDGDHPTSAALSSSSSPIKSSPTKTKLAWTGECSDVTGLF